MTPTNSAEMTSGTANVSRMKNQSCDFMRRLRVTNVTVRANASRIGGIGQALGGDEASCSARPVTNFLRVSLCA